TGSIALLAFIFADYASQVYSLGNYSEAIYAFSVITALTLLNMLGLTLGANAQKIFTVMEVGGILIIIFAGLFFTPDNPEQLAEISTTPHNYSFGMAMVF